MSSRSMYLGEFESNAAVVTTPDFSSAISTRSRAEDAPDDERPGMGVIDSLSVLLPALCLVSSSKVEPRMWESRV
jgi:hypothetical protein